MMPCVLKNIQYLSRSVSFLRLIDVWKTNANIEVNERKSN